MIELDRALHDQIRSYGAKTYKAFLCSEVTYHWEELVDESIATQITPVTIENGVLYVRGANSAFQDQLKFYADEIIEAINENFGQEEPLVKEIRPAKTFQTANRTPKENEPPYSQEPKVPYSQITLTDEDIKYCEDKANRSSDPESREFALIRWKNYILTEKFKLANDWHKCAKCDVLVEPKETFCEVCKTRERAAMIEELYRIFYDTPQTKPDEARRLVLEKMPHMAWACFPEAIESARVSLIQNIANQVRFNDEKFSEKFSDKARLLVALEKRLPLENLTDVIIERTLCEMRFDLADRGANFDKRKPSQK